MASTKSQIPKLPPGAPRPKAALSLFNDGARYVLGRWDLLKTAVVEEWGGPKSRDKFDHIVDDLLENCAEQWREGNDLHIDTLDVYLLECLESDYNIDFEDDSPVTAVSTLLQALFRLCAAGDEAGARALLAGVEAHPAMQGGVRRAEGDDDDDDSGSSDGEEEEEGGGAAAAAGAGGGGPRRVVDDDGWETIVPKGRGKAGGARGGAEGAAAKAPAAGAGAVGAAAAAAPPPSADGGGGMDVDDDDAAPRE